MDINKVNSKKLLKNIDWKSFFNMRIFRYTFLKQLRSVVTYICFAIAVLVSVFTSLDLINTYAFFFSPFFVLIIFIPHKSLQLFREEMDDGTLLIFNSMPYSRLKLVIQKWLSLQVICLIFVLIIILTKPFFYLMFQGFSLSAWENTRFLYKSSLSFIIYVTAFQSVFSTFTVLISLYFGQKATMAFSSLFFYLVSFVVLGLLFIFHVDMTIFSGPIFSYVICPLITLLLLNLVILVVYKKDFS